MVTFFPADGQFPASIINKFVPLMEKSDMVLGYLPEVRRSLLATCLSFMERILFAILFGPLPKFQGIMMFRHSLLGEFELKSRGRGWGVVMEFIIRVKRAGHRITSAPTDYRPRMRGRSKVNNLTTVWANLAEAIALRGHLSRRPTPRP
jgi:hypothetical protein